MQGLYQNTNLHSRRGVVIESVQDTHRPQLVRDHPEAQQLTRVHVVKPNLMGHGDYDNGIDLRVLDGYECVLLTILEVWYRLLPQFASD